MSASAHSEKYGTEAMVNGVYFESVTEAMWFDYFTAAGMEPVAQPGSHYLSSADVYTPDFYLPLQRTFVEIKWGNVDYYTTQKAQDLARDTKRPVMLIDGRPLDPNTIVRLFSPDGDTMLLLDMDRSRDTKDDHTSYPPTFRLEDLIPAELFKYAEIVVDTTIDQGVKRETLARREEARGDALLKGIGSIGSRDARKQFAEDAERRKRCPGWYAKIEEW